MPWKLLDILGEILKMCVPEHSSITLHVGVKFTLKPQYYFGGWCQAISTKSKCEIRVSTGFQMFHIFCRGGRIKNKLDIEIVLQQSHRPYPPYKMSFFVSIS